MYYVGIDYSITSPGLCIYHDSKEFHPTNCHYFAFHDKPEKFKTPENVHLLQYPVGLEDLDRYNQLATEMLRAMYFMANPKDTIVTLEGYAMGARGRVFNIAENCAILKYFLYANGYQQPKIIAPTEVKKFAFNGEKGKGKATKAEMYDAYLNDGGQDLHSLLTPKKKVDSSFVMDMVDAYFVMKHGYFNGKYRSHAA